MVNMSRKVQIILLCEDSQHEAFSRRFLEKAGWNSRKIRVIKAPKGKGSGARYVELNYLLELQIYRVNRNRVNCMLVVVLDGDNIGIDRRIENLHNLCLAENLEPRHDDEQVALIIPTWNIETWLEYLDGNNVYESKKDYPRLERARECQSHVNQLYEMCKAGTLRQPAPPSLEKACHEYRTRIKSDS